MTCHHFEEIKKVPSSKASYAKGCPECLAMGSSWVHLRECLICGHVGCCDSSPNKHATRHYHSSKHPIMRSLEPGESWGWCFVDEVTTDLTGLA
ncbi:UBP-type zinc finger domain-containing protein [Granulicella paludicola]|uniref:UBP-type zinc finger domain-containing protein n=1 Tax=Granulicella paludicola TaxID=474951 RepID=UPI0021E0E5B3|nr:UBP-type zinc finger domain-containing protein [Granulicella paludicola]